MAQRTTVVLIDDLDGSPADETVGFGLDGESYEIDLTAAHAAALRDVLAPYLDPARRVGTRRPAATTTGPTTSPTTGPTGPADPPMRVGGGAATADREQNRAIRAWAARHGHPLSDRGRIPAAVTEAFHRSDPSALETPEEPATVGPDGLTAPERETIRAWALEEGIEVKARGRLTKDLIANYRAVAARRQG